MLFDARTGFMYMGLMSFIMSAAIWIVFRSYAVANKPYNGADK